MRLLLVLLVAGCCVSCEKQIREARTPATEHGAAAAPHTSGATFSIAASVGLKYSWPKTRRWLSIS